MDDAGGCLLAGFYFDERFLVDCTELDVQECTLIVQEEFPGFCGCLGRVFCDTRIELPVELGWLQGIAVAGISCPREFLDQ